MTQWDPIEEGWCVSWEDPGIGRVYHTIIEKTSENTDDDEPEIEHVNDEGEEDEIEVPSEIWLARANNGKETFTKSGEAFARTLLTDLTGNQYNLFA